MHFSYLSFPYRRVSKFRTDYTEMRNQFEKLKAEAAQAVRTPHSPVLIFVILTSLSSKNEAARRAELIPTSATPLSPSDTRQRRFQTTNPPRSTIHPGLRSEQPEVVSESPFRGSTPQNGFGREHRALDEHTFIQNTDTRLDEFLAQGREVLENLKDQRNMLKGTQRRLLDAANTLGLSRNVIGWIEKRRCGFWFCSTTTR